MGVREVEFLKWAKLHRRCRFEMAGSGMLAPRPEDFDAQTASLPLEEHGRYGRPALIQAIAHRYGEPPERVLPVAGTSTANFMALACAANPGDRVLIEQPAYEPLPRVAEFLHLQPVPLRRPAGNRFIPDVDSVSGGLAGGARAVVISNLHNPSGLCCPQDVLHTIAELCGRRHATLIVDEVYLDFAHVNRGCARSTAANLGDHVIATSSLTKVYGLGSLRAGWLLANPETIEQARRVMDHIMVVNAAPAEALAVQALRAIDRLAERTRRLYYANYPVLRDWLASRDDLISYGNDGALFEFVGVAGVADTRPLCELLAKQYETQIVPGHFFGAPDHVRIGFALENDALKEGLSRLSEGLDRFRRL